jgi:hypothetical protein
MDADLRPLTAHDRCDRCGSQAYIEIGFEPAALAFCFHHWKKYGEKIKEADVPVTADDLAKIGAER